MPGIARHFSRLIDDNIAFTVQIDIHRATAPVKDFVDLFIASYVLTFQFLFALHIFPPFFLVSIHVFTLLQSLGSILKQLSTK